MKRKLGGLFLAAGLLALLAVPAFASSQQTDYGGDPTVSGPACADLLISNSFTPALSLDGTSFYGYITAETQDLCNNMLYKMSVAYTIADGGAPIGSVSGLGKDAKPCGGTTQQCVQGGLAVAPSPTTGQQPTTVCVTWTVVDNDGTLDTAPELPDSACKDGAAISSSNGGTGFH